MNKLIVMVGLPRSGKSTWIKTNMGGVPIVCPDAIRLALHGQRFITLAEPFVWAIAHVMVRALFLSGHERVVVDGCHTTRKRRDAWYGPEWQTWFKWIDTPELTCLDRAQSENDDEIIPIIQKMAAEFEGIQTDELQLDPPPGARVGA
jgi:predicted kinase